MCTRTLSCWVEERYAEAGRLPEFVHVGRIAGLGRSATDAAVAWLHDIVEDNIATLNEVRTELTKSSAFTEQEIDSIIHSVDVLERRKNERESYAAYIERIIESGDARALRVKQLDLLDHLDPYLRHGLRPDQAQRYIAALDAFLRSPLARES
jgi:(p)ppGpp synthase/HD superfamily hydrolase